MKITLHNKERIHLEVRASSAIKFNNDIKTLINNARTHYSCTFHLVIF